MDEVTIRPARLSEARVVAEIAHQVYCDHAQIYPAEFRTGARKPVWIWVVRLLFRPKGYFVSVAVVRGQIVGLVSGGPRNRGGTAYSTAKNQLYIDHIGVIATERRKGIGRKLIKSVLALAASLRFARVSLDTWSFNSAAQALFEAEGLLPYRIHMWKEDPNWVRFPRDRPT